MWKRVITFLVLGMMAWGLSACYRDAGENVQPTSNRVELNDIMPTTPPPPTALSTATPTPAVAVTATRTLVPTTTPPGEDQVSSPAATATSLVVAGPSNTPQFAPSFTPAVPAQSPTGAGIATPGMSDIQPSATPAPTLNPALQPTPTSIPVEQNPCVHVVQSGDTLYSIARDNNVELNDLVSANPAIFGGNPEVMLQIGWELQLPGCSTGEPTAQPTNPAETPGVEAGEVETQPTAASGTVTHVVQAGEGIYSIARQYGVDPQAIIDANNLANPNLIHPGDVLIIPMGQ